MAYNEDSSASGHDEPWIQWFCGLKGHEMFCEVERSYIEDGFNLYGLRTCVSNFSDCLDLILDRIGPDDSDDSHLTQSACTLYGLIHARYIITAHGLDAMYNKYASKEFGTCPLVQCAGQPVLPLGLKDEMGSETVKIFCPKCQCVYHPPPIRWRNHGGTGPTGVDGAAFGTTFAHLFLMTFSNLVPDPLPQDSAYIPRVFGFRVHMSARQRASGGSNTSSSSSASATRHQQQQQQQQQRESNNAIAEENNRRSSSVGRRSLDAKDKKDPSASASLETSQDQAVTGLNPKGGGRKGGTATNSKQVIEEDSSAKKTKSGKRKNDNESGNSNSNNSKKSNGEKRRRKAEN